MNALDRHLDSPAKLALGARFAAHVWALGGRAGGPARLLRNAQAQTLGVARACVGSCLCYHAGASNSA